VVCEELAATLASGADSIGTPSALATSISIAYSELGVGYTIVADDFARESLSGLGFEVISCAFSDLATLFPSVSFQFDPASIEFLAASVGMQAIADYLDAPIRRIPTDNMPPGFVGLREMHRDIAASMMSDFDRDDDPLVGEPDASMRLVSNCEMWKTTMVLPLPQCGGWSIFAGGIGIGVVVSTDVAADCGLWRRSCTFTALVTLRCICTYYGGEWDRFWGRSPLFQRRSKVVLTTETITETQWEWACGVPDASLECPKPESLDWFSTGETCEII
jgi:hypothetical protein